MIQEKELRIGNLLLFKGNKIKIDSVEISYCEQYKEEFNETFKPIELTEEILLKCGFVKCGVMADLTLNISYNRVLCYNHDHETVNMAQHTGGFKNLRDVHLNKINYLHQLQNLFWCLTGKELNIEL